MKDFPNHRNRKKIAKLRHIRNFLTVTAVILAISIVAVYFLTAPFGVRADAPRIFPTQRIILPRREQSEETTQATTLAAEPPAETEAVNTGSSGSSGSSGHSSGGHQSGVPAVPAETTSATTETAASDPTDATQSVPQNEDAADPDGAGDSVNPDKGTGTDSEGNTANGGSKEPEYGSADNGGKGPDNGSTDNDGKGPDNGSADNGGKGPDNGSADNGGKGPDNGSADNDGKGPDNGSADNGGKGPDNGSADNGGKGPDNGSADNGGKGPDNGSLDNSGKGPDNGTAGNSGKGPDNGTAGNSGNGSQNAAPDNGGANAPAGSTPGNGEQPGGTGTPTPANADTSRNQADLKASADRDEAGSVSEDLSVSGNKSALAGTESWDTPPSVLWITVFFILIVLLAADIIFIIILNCRIRSLKHQVLPEQGAGSPAGSMNTVALGEERNTLTMPNPVSSEIQIANLQHIGARPRQEDSSGVSRLSDGVIAIVADGMGGLAGGDRVSQKIVYTMLECSSNLAPGQMDGVLPNMVNYVTDTINTMIGEENYYKMGSTLLAVLVRNNRFHWITVGDSHIYLFRDGSLIQLNQEHNRGQDLLLQAVQGDISFSDARNAPKKGGLTSFIGMGKLRCVDRSLQQIPLQAGDRIMLCTDGVFNTLPDNGLEAILRSCPDIQQAADQIQQTILQRNHPKQDNFTAIILGF